MSAISDKIKINAVFYFVLSLVIRWGYNFFYILYKGFSPLEMAVIHELAALTSLILAWMSYQMFKKHSQGSNLGCFFLVLIGLNLLMSAGAVFAGLVHLFGAGGGELETIWLM